MNKIVLVGGIYGSGKSTLARSLEREVAVVDYDAVVGDLASDGIEKIASEMVFARQYSWQFGFIGALAESAQNNPVTVGVGTFATRERRDRYFDTLSEVAEVSGLYFMIPMRESIARIRETRQGATKLVNSTTVLDFYREHNRVFKTQNNNDFKFPFDLPPEYCALLTQSGYRHSPREQRWQVLTKPVSPMIIERWL